MATITCDSKTMQPTKMAELAASVVKNKPYIKYAYTLEFTKKENLDYHPHVHLLYEINGSKPSADINQFKNKFKVAQNHVDIKFINEKEVKDKVRYLMGFKQESKMAQVEKDILIRQENNLKDFYYNEEFLSQYII